MLALMKTLLKTSKVDFLMLMPHNQFTLNKFRTTGDFENHIFQGIPNTKYSTDHFNTWVELTLNDAGQFDAAGYVKNVPPAQETDANSEYEQIYLNAPTGFKNILNIASLDLENRLLII